MLIIHRMSESKTAVLLKLLLFFLDILKSNNMSVSVITSTFKAETVTHPTSNQVKRCLTYVPLTDTTHIGTFATAISRCKISNINLIFINFTKI